MVAYLMYISAMKKLRLRWYCWVSSDGSAECSERFSTSAAYSNISQTVA